MADRKISDLTALTTPATGDLIPIVDISEAAAADKNKSITVGELLRGAPDGTAAAPGIAFESDGGNGIFLGGTDILAFSTGGTQAVTIDASQRLGIGISGPQHPLHVVGASLVTGDGYFGASRASQTGFAQHVNIEGTDASLQLYQTTTGSSWELGNDNTGLFRILNGGSDRFAITSAGNVGIGESAPESLLHLKGSSATVKIENSVNTNYSAVEFDRAADDTHFAIYAYDSSHPNHANNVQFYGYQAGRLDFHTNSSVSPRLSIASGGNVAIGNASPVYQLDLNRTGSTFWEAGFDANQSGANLNLDVVATGTSGGRTGQIRFLTGTASGGSEAARIDSSGRLLVGTPTARTVGGLAASFQLEGTTAATSSASLVRNGGNPYLKLYRTGSASIGSVTAVPANAGLAEIDFGGSDGTNVSTGAYILAVNDSGSAWTTSSHPTYLKFATTPSGSTTTTERMRILNNGYMRIMCQDFSSEPGTSNQGIQLSNPINTASRFSAGSTTSSVTQIAFINGNGVVGTIVTNGSATAYNTSSDYRLKENVTAVTDGITRLQQLKPSRFNFIADPDKTVDGFVAHEVQTIVPEAITGEKDAVDADGNPEYQGIDQSKLVPLLTAALQEAIAKIETLEQRLNDAGIS